MSVLSITNAEVLTLARLPLTGDAVATADVTAVLGYEQDAQEQRIQPTALANTTIRPLLRRAVAKIVAAEVLEMRARDNSNAGFTGSGVTVSKPDQDFPKRLRADAEQELSPYLIPAAVSAKEAAETSVIANQADLVAAQLDNVGAETLKITAETGVISSLASAEVAERNARATLAGAKAETEATNLTFLSTREQQVRTDTTLAQLQAGLITRAEARAALTSGSVPVALVPVVLPGTTSPASSATQSKLFGRSEGDRANNAD